MSEEKQSSERTEPRSSRPRMPASYGVDPTADQGTLPWSYVRDWMTNSRNYWVATTRPDGRPHVVPVWGVWHDEAFYFSTDPNSRKGRNLAANPELVVHLESGDEVVVFEGTAEEVTDPAVFARFANAYQAKYQVRPEAGDAVQGFYRLRPKVVFAWREEDFTSSATRWTFDPD